MPKNSADEVKGNERCPKCYSWRTTITDSRPKSDGRERFHYCEDCQIRFKTKQNVVGIYKKKG